ncbi:hypothetical protein [Micromonospora sp. NPDC005707]
MWFPLPLPYAPDVSSSPAVSARVAGASFVITSTSASDATTVAYEMFEPG